MSPYEAFHKAKRDGFTDELQIIACSDAYNAVSFAMYVKGADIKYCQEQACRDANKAYFFTLEVPEADVAICQEAACKDDYVAYRFAFIKGSDVEYCKARMGRYLETYLKDVMRQALR